MISLINWDIISVNQALLKYLTINRKSYHVDEIVWPNEPDTNKPLITNINFNKRNLLEGGSQTAHNKLTKDTLKFARNTTRSMELLLQ